MSQYFRMKKNSTCMVLNTLYRTCIKHIKHRVKLCSVLEREESDFSQCCDEKDGLEIYGAWEGM